ncbi:MAG TPA: hypothetical protein VFW98_14690 [Gemmatimonadaceae bacterium]|nr:hypothetical protein [Gemmatimonadaceae bacterium]
MTSRPRALCAMLVVAALGALLTVLVPVRASAQGQGVDGRLASRVDSATRATLAPVLDSARATGLPTEPLVEKALEGASKRAPGARIVAAVRALRGDLETARAALGTGSSAQEIVAGAGALRAGVDASHLQQLRADRPGRSLAIPLTVLGELIARGVPVDTAATVIASLERDGAADEDFVALRQSMGRHGGPFPLPAAAAAHARGAPASVGPPPGRALGRSHRKRKP